MKKKILYIVAIAALTATSCTKNSGETDPVTTPVAINFIAELNQTKAGHLDENGGFSDGDMIGVFGYQKANNVEWAGNELPQLMHNVTLTRQTFVIDESNSTINYVYNPQKMWPNLPNKARFFAYYPHSSSVAAGVITPSPETHSGFPYVEVALGASSTPVDFVTAQTGLMNKTEEAKSKGVKFAFTHQLSKLFFQVRALNLDFGLDPDLGETRKMYINLLTIKNISNKAKYTFYDGGEPADGAWTEHSSSGETMISNSIMAEIGGEFQNMIDPNGAGSYILMIPQKNDNVEIEVIYTIERLNPTGGCEDRVVTVRRFPVSVKWESSKVYTYYLEFGFKELSEAAIKLNLSVKDWVVGGYDVEMGKK